MKWHILFISSLIISIGECSQSEDGHCFADDKDCQNGQQSELSDTSKTDKFVPFRFSHRSHFKDDWDSFIKTYSKWQNGLLSNSKLKCTDLQAVVFKPTAGLGDSANALSAAFLYTIRAGMMFFIDWQPWDWETGFAGPGFQVSYSKMIKEKRLCESPNLVHLDGHITASHKLAKIRKLNEDISFNAVRFFQTFFTPSDPVQKIIDSIKLPSESIAMVIRTGWDDWQRFLVKETEDPLKFPACIEGWRSKGTIDRDSTVFLTSDREDVKSAVETKLKQKGFKVIRLENSATHVMQNPESIEKVHKTIAEFHLISQCKYAMLTASSLFGRTAVTELGGLNENRIVYISASDCNKPHKGYYRCANPKYPSFCPLDNASFQWEKIDNKDELR